MNIKLLLMVFFLLLFSKQEVYSQAGFSHEVGIITGPVMLYSDFGERGNFETNTKNVGFGIGLIHYLNFAYSANCNCYTRETYFNDHFKIRNEFDYHKTNLEHYGRWVAPERTSEGADKLRAMSGSSSVLEIGSQLEYYPLSIRDFDAGAFQISPFFSLGVHWVNYSPNVKSSMPGKLNDVVIPKYYNAFQQEGGSTWGIVGSVGIRYKLTKMSDLMLDSRWEYYFNDYVDGLNPTFKNNEGRARVPENKSNDWIYWLNVGYIYYLN